MVPVVLTIAGSDPSGGAGLQADLKTFHALRTYGSAVVTAITVQNTLGVRQVEALRSELVAAQLAAVLEDLPVAAIKTGLLATAAQVRAVATALASRPGIPLVVDPVLVAGSGDRLASADVAEAISEVLLPCCTVITPNLDEAAQLTGSPVVTLEDMRHAATVLAGRGTHAVVVKGGHLPGDPCDVLLSDGVLHVLRGARLGTERRHGTGCTFSAAVAAYLAQGSTLDAAVAGARDFVRMALLGPNNPGRGSRPLDHLVGPKTG